MVICYEVDPTESLCFHVFSHQDRTNPKHDGMIGINNNCCRCLYGKIKPFYPIMSQCRNPQFMLLKRKGSFAFAHVQPSMRDKDQRKK